MGLISTEVEVGLCGTNIEYYRNLGYQIPMYKNVHNKLCVAHGTSIKVNIKDLLRCSNNIRVQVKCDKCNKIYNINWWTYKRCVKNNNSYYCVKCANISNKEKMNETKLAKSISFSKWCILNEKQDLLSRWDYSLNISLPTSISYASHKSFYFKCPVGIHESELKTIGLLTIQKGNIDCNKCNSFAQWGIDNLGEDFLEKYWDYNNNFGINPWDIDKGSSKTIWVKCQEKFYHNSYLIKCFAFITNRRCPYCSSRKIHPLDSLGKFLEDKNLLYLYSNKNKESAYTYAPRSNRKVWWKCPDGSHKDFYRKINASYGYDFRCPECQYSKGENKIGKWLLDSKINYITQKEFDGLLGLGNGNLSYDFYLPDYKLLIEYQGEQHEKFIKGFHTTNEDFKKQKEHDKRKREYAKNNNINLLEIWYWDFDNIEKILKEKLGD